MSIVTNVVLLSPIDAAPSESILVDLGFVKLHDYVGKAPRPGQNKGFEADLWAGAFNHLNWNDFRSAIEGIQWESKDEIQVLVKEQEDDRFRLWQFDRIGKLIETA